MYLYMNLELSELEAVGVAVPQALLQLQPRFQHKVSSRSFYKSQFPPKSVNLSCFITNIKNKLTGLCGNRLLQIESINTFDEIRLNLELSKLDAVGVAVPQALLQLQYMYIKLHVFLYIYIYT